MDSTRKEFLAGRIYAIDEAGKQRSPENPELTDVHNFVDTYLSETFDNMKNINGDFCGALKQNTKWILFRDHMGVRTLYYYLKGKDFAFAEDMRDLFTLDGIDLSINERLFYLRARGANTNTLTETDFQYIQCVQPGSYTDFEPTEDGWKITVHPYWTPGQKKIRYETEQQYIDKLRELVEDAVKIRLDSVEGPVGAELSGGLDSGVIDILIARSGREAKYVSWSAPYDIIPMQPVDERQVIEDICEQEGIEFFFLPKDDTGIDPIKRRLPPFVNTPNISRTAKFLSEQDIHFVFSGHGGDEGVSHRANILELWYSHERKEYFKEVWRGRKGHRFRLCGTVTRIAKGILYELPKRKKSWQRKDLDLKRFMTRSFLNKMKNEQLPPLCFSYDPKHYILHGGSRDRLDNCACQGRDFDVRYLFPLLDYRIVDYALGIPRNLFYRNGVNRYIYRQSTKDLMPKSLYEVQYKNFPSIDNFLQKMKCEKIPMEGGTNEVKGGLSCINWPIWKSYIDYDECRTLIFRSQTKRNKNTSEFALYTLFFYMTLSENSSLSKES